MSYSFPNEHAAAFDLSRREFRNGQDEIAALLDQGLSVVAVSGPAYCRFTDAIVGTQYSVVSKHMARSVAERRAVLETDMLGDDLGEFRIHVFPQIHREEPEAVAENLAEEDILF